MVEDAPEPLHMPPTRTARPPTVASIAVALRTRSVVHMLVAAALAASEEAASPATKEGMAASSCARERRISRRDVDVAQRGAQR